MTDPLLHLVFEYSYAGLFLAMSLGILGVPFPDELLLTASGYMISQGKMPLLMTMLAAIGGSVAGMSISYLIGRKIGRRLFEGRLGRLFGAERLGRHGSLLESWGEPLLLVGFFIPGVRHATALLYGASRKPYGSFLFFTSVGALLWTSVFLLVGSLLGEHWRDISTLISKDGAVAAGALAAIVLVWLAVRRLLSLRRM
ncbi:DedA family protein [Cohnella fermenti]|nr:DedA family protein [Cohnella fermenti]